MNGIKVRIIKTNNQLKSAGYEKEDEINIYNDVLKDVYANPRWYLNNLHYLAVFRVSWGDYRYNRAILPQSND